jgi:hypothetical protein
MVEPEVKESAEARYSPPPLRRDAQGQMDAASLADVIQWFLDYDERVAIIKHPHVEELFQWKQEEHRRENADLYAFSRAEDRLAIGIMQALAEHASQRALHGWLSQLLKTLDEARRTNEEMSEAYGLEMGEGVSALKAAVSIPAERTRNIFLTSCWLEALCTAEARVLGWVYRELYGMPYAP